jgi:hypothetical protein
MPSQTKKESDVSLPFREADWANDPPKGPCLDVPHVHCDECPLVWPVEANHRETVRTVLIHIRDEHPEAWAADPEYAQIAPEYGVECI